MMTTHTAFPQASRRTARRRPLLEFCFYFALIFAFALPFACIGWARDVIRRRTLILSGPFARAWAEASCTTPLIFSV
jgi:hypothetical protein